MSKYGESLGFWMHKIGKIEHKLKPKKSDNLALANVIHFQKEKTLGWVLEQIGELYKGMVLRAYPNLTDQDKQELDEWIGMNYNQIFKDLMIAFRWTTKEAIESAEKEQLEAFSKKKLIET